VKMNNILKEIKSNAPFYILLTAILITAFIIRIYRVGELTQFYYDQGRDALVIWDLWQKGKPFLIGPITGLKGIFLGPFYYYLIAPFYLIGGGNPSYPAVFLAFLSILAIVVLYILGLKMHSRRAGLIAVMIASFSYYIYQHSRWLSNPNAILLTSTLFLWSLWEIKNQSKSKFKSMKNYWWVIAFLMIGLSLQLESASAVFYIPILVLFMIWHYGIFDIVKKQKSVEILKLVQNDGKGLIIGGGVFLATLLPQIVFDFRHDNILLKNFTNLIFGEKAFRGFTEFIFFQRMDYFWNAFSTKLFPGPKIYLILFVTISLSAYIFSFRKFRKTHIPLFLVYFLTPIIFYTFFQGNYGNIYDYYLSGYFFPFILLFSVGLAEIWEQKLGFIFIIFFFYYFFLNNLPVVKNHLLSTPETRPIAIGDQLRAVRWIYEDAKGEGEFNVDIYVPPVIPYAYDYLLLWQGTLKQDQGKCRVSLCGKVSEEKEIVYVIAEPETTHLDRWESWIDRYNKSTKIVKKKEFGQVKVQKRLRN